MILLASFIPYLAFQVYATIKCRGGALALLPFAWMVSVGIVTFNALRDDSNMWPCMLVPASLGTILYLAVLVASGIRAKEPRGFGVEPSCVTGPEQIDISN